MNYNQKGDNKIAAIITYLKRFDHCKRNQSKPLIQEAGEFYTTNITTRSIYDKMKYTRIQINWQFRSYLFGSLFIFTPKMCQ